MWNLKNLNIRAIGISVRIIIRIELINNINNFRCVHNAESLVMTFFRP